MMKKICLRVWVRQRFMSDTFHFFDEPLLTFGDNQAAEDPRDGLALFEPCDPKGRLPEYVVIGSRRGVQLWSAWVSALNSPASCIDIARQRPWPPYPGYDVAFGAPWPESSKTYLLNDEALESSA